MRYNLLLHSICISLLITASIFAESEIEQEQSGDLESLQNEKDDSKSSVESYSMFLYASTIEEDDVDKAEKIYLAIAAKDPDSAYVYYKLARVYWRKGNIPKTYEYFEKAIEKNPRIKEAYSDYAIVKRINRDNAGSIEVYERAVKAIKDNLDFYRILADSYLLQKDAQKALEKWIDASKEHPDEAEPYVNVINLNLILKKPDDAKKAFEEGLKNTNGSYRFLDGARDAYIRNGDVKTADEIGKMLLKIRPTSVKLWIEHINFLLSNKDSQGAKKAYFEAKEKLSKRADFFLDAGMTFEDFSDIDTALQIYLDGLQIKPDDGNLLIKIASLYNKRGQSDKAREYYEKILKLKPDSPQYYLLIAESQEKDGLYNNALETYREASKKFPTSKEVSQKIIMILIRLGNYEEAEKEFENLTSLYPKEHALKVGYIALLNINGKYDSALETALKLLQEYPFPELLQEISNSYYGKQQYDKSAEYLEKAIDKTGDIQPSAYARLGTLYRKAENLAKSKENYDKAIRILETEASQNDEKYKSFYSIASIYELMGEKENAGKYFQKAIDDLKAEIEKSPDNVKLIITIADFFQKIDNLDEAEKYYQIAITKDTKDPTALNNLGYMWIEKGIKLDKALDYVKKALEIEPDNPAYLDSLGWGLFKKKKYDEALIHLKKAVEAGAEDAVIFDHLGDTFYKLKKYEDAIINWEKALKLEPENPEKIKAKIDEAKNKLPN